MKDAFYEDGYSVEGFDVIKVPSVWQMAGYDTHQYTNIRYPFPFDPPYVPQDIPCGAYVHTFDYAKMLQHQRHILTLKVWIAAFMYG